MNLLSREQLEKLTTKRLLAYKNKLMQVHDSGDWNDYCICFQNEHINKTSPEWQETYQNVKSVLATREHIERK